MMRKIMLAGLTVRIALPAASGDLGYKSALGTGP